MHLTLLKAHIRSVLLLIPLSFVCTIGFSQDSLNTEALFVKARKLAFDNNDFPQAISVAKQALSKDPTYVDLYIFLGRLYAWKKDNDSARYYFNTALSKNPG